MRDPHKDQRRGHRLRRPFAAVGNSPAAAAAAVLRSGSSCSAGVGRTGPEADRIGLVAGRIGLEAVHSPVLAAAGRDWACRCSSLGCRLPGCCSNPGAVSDPGLDEGHTKEAVRRVCPREIVSVYRRNAYASETVWRSPELRLRRAVGVLRMDAPVSEPWR
jgi:hypothetical protein